MSNTYSVSIEGCEIKNVSISCAQDMGKRNYQEDSVVFCGLKNGAAAVVADGMGGLKDGKQLSSYVTEKMLEGIKAFSADIPIHKQFSSLIDELNKYASESGSGSTVCAVYCCAKGVFWCSVGDSRLYLIRKGKICRLTEDGDYFNMLLELVLKDSLSLESADNDPQRDYLFQYIGADRRLLPDCSIRPLIPEKGDALLICSDGVYNSLTDEELAKTISEQFSGCAGRIAELVMAKDIPTQDNLTALVLKFE
ncbi:MAG: PP2C family protein-serine/threonine phosphatase [Oscillospiraceae bacterium]